MAFSIDEGYQYAARLRGSLDVINPLGWNVDWSDSPWPLKIYAGGRRIQLSGLQPEWITRQVERRYSGVASLEHLLFYAVGCIHVRWLPKRSNQVSPELMMPGLNVGRAIASGGAMYPAEVYVYARTLSGLANGLYHYNPARHELVELQRNIPDTSMCRILSLPTPAALGEVILVITNYFWKNFFKYADFSYRLGAMNIGVALGRLHRLGEKEFGKASVHFCFDDNPLNTLLGLQGQEESAYAVLVLGKECPAHDPGNVNQVSGQLLGTSIAQPQVRQRSKVIKRSDDFEAMHESVLASASMSMLEPVGCTTDTEEEREFPIHGLALPTVRSQPFQNLENAISRRISNGAYFTGGMLAQTTLAVSLQETHKALQHLRKWFDANSLPSPLLYCIVQNVQGIEAGSYKYQASTHSLMPIRIGYFSADLQKAFYARNVNMQLSAYTIHIVDILDFRKSPYGNRTYRMQQMQVGAALDTIMLVSSACNAGSHVQLGFNAKLIDQMYALDDSPYGTQAQICVGTVRHGLYREGSIIS